MRLSHRTLSGDDILLETGGYGADYAPTVEKLNSNQDGRTMAILLDNAGSLPAFMR